MTFQELINEHKNTIKCSTLELSTASGLSQPVISRYLNGKRIPTSGSIQLKQLCHGLYVLSERNDCVFLSEKELITLYESTLDPYDKLDFPNKLNSIISVLGISNSSLADALNFDASYISKIRTGNRIPSDIVSFVDKLCNYILNNYNSSKHRAILAQLLSSTDEELTDKLKYRKAIEDYFLKTTDKHTESVENFFHKMDNFNLNEYIKIIHFDELKVPTIPFAIHTSKDYYGIEEIKNGELDFLKETVTSPSNEPVYMFSDMPIADMTNGDDFMQKFMLGLAMILKKGLHIHVVHDLDRPFDELMMGLIGWMPLYMTGLVHPYYFKNYSYNLFGHLNYCSGSVALEGQCIAGFHADAKYHLTKVKKELKYYKQKTRNLMTKASPLMDIYREDSASRFKTFLMTDAKSDGIRHNILSSLPIYTISDELLEQILSHNKVSDEMKASIIEYVTQKRALFQTVLSHSQIIDEIGLMSEEEYINYPMILSLSDIYVTQDIFYTYEEYLEHLEQTRIIAKEQMHYSLIEQNSCVFRNIQIRIHEDKLALISKNKTPVIHFVIHHPTLLAAIEQFHV